jgi:succinate-acetate transporter protein
MQQQISIQSQHINNSFSWGDYFSFRKMITLQVIQVVYAIVAVIITLGGIIALFSGGSSLSEFLPGGRFTVFLFIIFGNLLWRMWCELTIVFFRINNTLTNIDANTKVERRD